MDGSKRRLWHFAGSIVLVVLATLVRFALDPVLHDRAPLITYLFAVAFAAWLGGLWPGLLALVLGGMSAAFFFVSPRGSLQIERVESQIAFGLFFVTGLIIVLLAESQRVARRRAEASALQALDRQARLEAEIARRERAEREREGLLATLREADARKNEFIAVLAHEIRNPLAAIRNSLRLMRRDAADASRGAGQFDPEAERLVAEHQVAHLSRLVDDLMDVSRISRGRIELRKRPVDLLEVISRAVEATRSALDRRGHSLSVDLPGSSIRLEADPTRLEQVIGNLLNNAAKYTPPGGEIAVSAFEEGDEAVVTVRDTGLGMSAEVLPTVFEMFVQDAKLSGRSQGGLGIGLGISKNLVELHGGRISARSEGPGAGSEFEVRLPLALREIPAPDFSPAEPPLGTARRAQAHARRRVLVVDDNEVVARSLARILERMYGQETRVANGGFPALELADSFRPELILLDIGMPDLDGCEVARRLRLRPEFAETYIVALTGWGQEADRRRSEEAGIDRHMVKPIDPDLLGELIAESKMRATVP